MIHKQSRDEEQDKDTVHTCQGAHTQLFNIQTIFLVEAIGVLDLWTMAPLSVHVFSITSREDRHVGDQNQVTLLGPAVSHQDPQHLLRHRQVDLEPPQVHLNDGHLARVGKGHLALQRQRDGGDQVVQGFFFPAAQTVVVHFAAVMITLSYSSLRSVWLLTLPSILPWEEFSSFSLLMGNHQIALA